MLSLERVHTALSHEKPDRTPRLLYGELIGYVPAVRKMLSEKCGDILPRRFFEMDMTGVCPKPSQLATGRFKDYYEQMADRVDDDAGRQGAKPVVSGEDPPVDEWGVWRREGSFHHFTHIESPLSQVTDVAELERYPWPDLDQAYRFQGMRAQIQRLHDEGLATAAFAGSIFEQAWYLRGLEKLIEDMMLDPDMANVLLDRTAYFQKHCAEQMTKAGVDMIMFGDDVAMQTGLMMSAAMWRRFLKPRLAASIAAARAVRKDVHVFYHSDGKLDELIGDLIEIGVNVLNPVQPECMDAEKIRKQYGKAISFLGTVSVQQTMPFGTADQVRQEVKERIESVGIQGGLVLAPAHVLEPEVPWANIAAFFEASNQLIP